MTVEELEPGLWRWTALHPDWREGADWEPDVGCVYAELPGATVLIDPLVPLAAEDRERFLEALDRDVERRRQPLAILLTCEWHRRSTDELVERYGATLSELPPGVVALPFEVASETMYWLPAFATLVPGDALLGDGEGGVRVCPDEWLEGEDGPARLREALRALLDLPLERILVSHGDPVRDAGRAALVGALVEERL